MNAGQWILAALGLVAWTAQGLALAWSIYALHTGHDTTSRFMSALPPGYIFLAGLAVGFLAGHWWRVAP